MPDYQKGKIYKIVDLNEEMMYIGSTTKDTLAQRMAQHRSTYKKQYTSSHDIFDTYGIENCKILLIENYPCNSRDELNKREGELIRQFDCVNKLIPGRTLKQYYNENKVKLCENQKIYDAQHKPQIAIKQKKWRAENTQRISEYNKAYREAKKSQLTVEECQQLSQ